MRVSVNGTELYVDVDGPQLHLDEDRLVQRPTMVVLHGGPGFDQGYLRPGLGPLSADVQLVFVDLRGQGRSERMPARTCTLERMADDVARLCDRLGITAPIVFGHSAGGFVALHLALRHPDSVGGLILCGTAPTLAPLPDDDPPPSLEQRASAEAVLVAQRLFGGDFSPETFDAFSRLVFPFYAGPRHTGIPQRIMRLSDVSLDVAAYFFRTLAPTYDLRPRLPEISVPTLAIVGRYDWVCPPAAARLLAAQIPGAHLVEIADAGHFVFSEEPQAFQDAVRAFLAGDQPHIAVTFERHGRLSLPS
ncbi:alpha/beta hydrolase [Nonomuraea sp. NPDC026600]|uniref:alpha/beta fold hydrolase n=1 Tax=Nonomuraea sp. NPDC026600 TaxID=3155363 RepID=UPI0033CBB917